MLKSGEAKQLDYNVLNSGRKRVGCSLFLVTGNGPGCIQTSQACRLSTAREPAT